MDEGDHSSAGQTELKFVEKTRPVKTLKPRGTVDQLEHKVVNFLTLQRTKKRKIGDISKENDDKENQNLGSKRVEANLEREPKKLRLNPDFKVAESEECQASANILAENSVAPVPNEELTALNANRFYHQEYTVRPAPLQYSPIPRIFTDNQSSNLYSVSSKRHSEESKEESHEESEVQAVQNSHSHQQLSDLSLHFQDANSSIQTHESRVPSNREDRSDQVVVDIIREITSFNLFLIKFIKNNIHKIDNAAALPTNANDAWQRMLNEFIQFLIEEENPVQDGSIFEVLLGTNYETVIGDMLRGIIARENQSSQPAQPSQPPTFNELEDSTVAMFTKPTPDMVLQFVTPQRDPSFRNIQSPIHQQEEAKEDSQFSPNINGIHSNQTRIRESGFYGGYSEQAAFYYSEQEKQRIAQREEQSLTLSVLGNIALPDALELLSAGGDANEREAHQILSIYLKASKAMRGDYDLATQNVQGTQILGALQASMNEGQSIERSESQQESESSLLLSLNDVQRRLVFEEQEEEELSSSVQAEFDNEDAPQIAEFHKNTEIEPIPDPLPASEDSETDSMFDARMLERFNLSAAAAAEAQERSRAFASMQRVPYYKEYQVSYEPTRTPPNSREREDQQQSFQDVVFENAICNLQGINNNVSGWAHKHED